MSTMQDKTIAQNFIQFAISNNVLGFGNFTTKAGRVSPYFFNAGLFNDGMALWQLANLYAQHILDSNIKFDVLFGPAYKGITLASVTACAMNHINNINIPFAFNRKEAKDHGEGGVLIGSSLVGKRVLIIDDVISAGTSIIESINLIEHNGGIVVGVTIALDRMEKSGTANNIGEYSAIQEIQMKYNIPVLAIANLHDLLDYVADNNDFVQYRTAINQYKNLYGI